MYYTRSIKNVYGYIYTHMHIGTYNIDSIEIDIHVKETKSYLKMSKFLYRDTILGD